MAENKRAASRIGAKADSEGVPAAAARAPLTWRALYRALAAWAPDLTVDGWWGITDPYERAWGTVLVQNTAWTSAKRALEGLRARGLTTPDALLEVADRAAVEEAIRPAGYFRQKAATLRRLAAFLRCTSLAQPSDADSVKTLRRALLAIKGVGEETADTLLLYVFRLPTFIGDAYTRRLAERLWGRPFAYGEVRRAVLDEGFSVDELALFHALIVEFGKAVCQKNDPRCIGCPLAAACQHAGRVGARR
ncbi:MAG TPA: hypothetical protein VIK75_08660 [Calditerricola sp.]